MKENVSCKLAETKRSQRSDVLPDSKFSHFLSLANVLLDLVLVSMCKKCSYNVNLSLPLSFNEAICIVYYNSNFHS